MGARGAQMVLPVLRIFKEAEMQPNNEQIEKMTTNYVQALSDMNSMVRDMVNATVESMSIMTKGCGDLCNSMSNLVQKQLDQTAKVSQSMMTTSNVNDMVNTQNSMMKSTFDSMMADMTNITQLSTRIAQQAAEPVAKQMNASLSKLSKIKAA